MNESANSAKNAKATRPLTAAELVRSAPIATDETVDSILPRSLNDIPGLGPIRVRALQKAGLDSPSAVRSATLEQLVAVPGLTEIKARHIQEYLAPFSTQELEKAAAPRPATEIPPKPVSGHPSPPADAASSTSPALSAAAAHLTSAAARALGDVVNLLLTSEATQFRSRLLKTLGQFAQRAESIAIDAPHLSTQQQERALRRLRRGSKALAEFRTQGAADKKAQARLADSLEEIQQKLADCSLNREETG